MELVRSEMQIVLSRNWTWVINSIIYNVNHYTKRVFGWKIYAYICSKLKKPMK